MERIKIDGASFCTEVYWGCKSTRETIRTIEIALGLLTRAPDVPNLGAYVGKLLEDGRRIPSWWHQRHDWNSHSPGYAERLLRLAQKCQRTGRPLGYLEAEVLACEGGPLFDPCPWCNGEGVVRWPDNEEKCPLCTSDDTSADEALNE